MVAKRMIYPSGQTAGNQHDVQHPLRPYKYQVGGHTAIFQLETDHICKPFNESERDFYHHTMPLELRQWVPQFCYEIELRQNKFTNTHDLHILNPNPSCSSHKQGQQLDNCPATVTSNETTNINPWALECQLRNRKKSDLNKFMVFENLCRDYSMPNVLDLKLGVRQYSENASEEKKRVQRQKCERSTSKQLGMRLCGLQYFDETLGTFQYMDKYHGRSLNVKQLYSLLAHFFRSPHDNKIRTDDCLALIEQIEQIKKEIQSEAGLRLFGVSMLIILEGRSDIPNTKPPIARLIDFAHATIDLSDSEPDVGCIMGLENLGLAMKNIVSE